jgi:FkbM family methyltransferase
MHDIDLVVDVGANTGQYGRSIRALGYRGPIVSVEPQSACHPALEAASTSDGNWTFERCALGETDGTLELHIAGNSLSSSLLPMLNRHVDAAPSSKYVRSERVPVRRLDDVLADATGHERLWLKVDTQGYEWPVLRGADKTLARTAVLELELSLQPLYEGQMLLPEMLAGLSELGFALAALHEVFTDPASNELLQVDGMFVHRTADVPDPVLGTPTSA